MNIQKSQTQLVNTLRIREAVAPAPKGFHIAGLVSIENCIKKYQENETDGFRFRFRLKDNPQTCVTYSVTATVSPKSNLIKFLSSADPNLPKTDITPELAFEVMKQQIDNWYQIMIEHDISPVNGLTYANIKNHTIVPVTAEMSRNWGKPSNFFKLWEENKKDPPEINFL